MPTPIAKTMNPFTIPFSGSLSWIEVLLSVGGVLVMLIYFYQVFWPKISDVLFPRPNYEERAAELLRQYPQQKADERATKLRTEEN